MIETIKRNYKNIFFWIQGAHDLEYLKEITDIKNISIIQPDIKEYSNILNDSIDYIGTRLHAGIFAMRHKVRSIIIRVDSRMDVMSECIPNNTISRMNMEKLDNMINNSIETKCNINFNAIERWKQQFE